MIFLMLTIMLSKQVFQVVKFQELAVRYGKSAVQMTTDMFQIL